MSNLDAAKWIIMAGIGVYILARIIFHIFNGYNSYRLAKRAKRAVGVMVHPKDIITKKSLVIHAYEDGYPRTDSNGKAEVIREITTDKNGNRKVGKRILFPFFKWDMFSLEPVDYGIDRPATGYALNGTISEADQEDYQLLTDEDNQPVRPWQMLTRQTDFVKPNEQYWANASFMDEITDENITDFMALGSVGVSSSPLWVEFLSKVHNRFKDLAIKKDSKMIGEPMLIWTDKQGNGTTVFGVKESSGEFMYPTRIGLGPVNWQPMSLSDAIASLN